MPEPVLVGVGRVTAQRVLPGRRRVQDQVDVGSGLPGGRRSPSEVGQRELTTPSATLALGLDARLASNSAVASVTLVVRCRHLLDVGRLAAGPRRRAPAGERSTGSLFQTYMFGELG